MDYVTFQAEHREWLNDLFPGQTPLFPAAGMVEEAGELLHVLLKKDQASVWGCESRYVDADWDAKTQDAIGDCAVYCCSLANSQDWNFDAMVEKAFSMSEYVKCRPILNAASRLVHLACAVTEDPDDPMRSIAFLALLMRLSVLLNTDFDAAVASVWSDVKGRRR